MEIGLEDANRFVSRRLLIKAACDRRIMVSTRAGTGQKETMVPIEVRGPILNVLASSGVCPGKVRELASGEPRLPLGLRWNGIESSQFSFKLSRMPSMILSRIFVVSFF